MIQKKRDKEMNKKEARENLLVLNGKNFNSYNIKKLMMNKKKKKWIKPKLVILFPERHKVNSGNKTLPQYEGFKDTGIVGSPQACVTVGSGNLSGIAGLKLLHVDGSLGTVTTDIFNFPIPPGGFAYGGCS